MAHKFYAGRFGEEALLPIENDEVVMVSKHYRSFIKNDIHTLDDTTWADLDMDVIYKKVNMTYSGAGDIMLYGMLRQPCLDQTSLTKRYAIMKWAKQAEEEREIAIDILSKAGKRYQDDLEQPLLECHAQTLRNETSYAMSILFLIAIVMAVLFQGWWVVLAVLLCVANIFRYWILHKRLEPYMDSLVYLVNHIEVLHKLAKQDFHGLTHWQPEAISLSKQLSSIRKNSALSYFDEIAGIINPLTQKESRLFNAYAKVMYENADAIKAAFVLVGTLDACIAMASFSVYDHVNCDIDLVEKATTIDALTMIHPLVEGCVANDVDIHEHRLLTGSNATGKSTYLKMIALNAILAQSFHFVYAKTYQAGFFQIATSMTIHDDIERKESTFVAEVKSLKYLLDIDDTQCPILCIIDEILRGTNTLERIASSIAILHQFANHNGICLGATHDIELTQVLQQQYRNYHFSERMEQERMVFDYKIHDGVTKTRNAITLLSIFQYNENLVEQARQRLSEFEKNGQWEKIA